MVQKGCVVKLKNLKWEPCLVWQIIHKMWRTEVVRKRLKHSKSCERYGALGRR